MVPNDSLTYDEGSYCMAKKGEVYVVYTEANADEIKLDVGTSGNTFEVKWFDPRNGGDLQNGSVAIVKANGIVELGIPTSEQKKDWVILVTKIKVK
jgi:hypothetical protein